MQINPIKNTINADLTAGQAQQVQRAQEAKQPAHEKPVEKAQDSQFYQAPDEYSHREPEEASGRYWLEAGEDGPKVNYSDPEAAPEKAASESEASNVTTTNTDDVDREIEQLRKKVEELQAQLSRSDGPEAERLEKQLKQAESELQRKDNDSYRRAHAKIS